MSGHPADADPRGPRVAVIILTFRQADLTLAVLGSLRRAAGQPFHVLVHDNGSNDDTVERVGAAFPEVEVVAGERNLGVAGGRNAAAAAAIRLWHPDYLLFLDNDMEIDPAFVTELARPLARYPGIGQTQAKLLQMDDPGRINEGGGCRIVWWRGRTMPVGAGEPDRGQYDAERSIMACGGGAMMVRAALFERLNGFDEAFNPYGPEDLDFSLRLLATGSRNLYVPTAVAYHAGSHTFGAGYTEAYARNKVRNWFLLLRRHATPAQKLAFYLVGGPTTVLAMAWREARRGNLGAAVAAVREAVKVIRPG